MTNRLFRLLTAVALAVLAVALFTCTGEKDLGLTCKMTSPCDASTPCPIPEARVLANTAVDYIALGSAECDDLACIRTRGSQNPANEEGIAHGYCTAPCIDNSDCSPNYEGKKGKLVCDQLMMDRAYMDQLQRDNPVLYEQTFGSGASSNYCILPRAE